MNRRPNKNAEDAAEIVHLTDEDGNDISFEYIDTIEYAGADYVFLLPFYESEGLIVLQVVETDDPEEDAFVGIEDKALVDAVFQAFKEKHNL